MKVICSIYRSTKKAEMYLYVEKSEGLKRVPEALIAMFGKPTGAMTLLITPTKKLARAEAATVISDIRSKGYYLQMPPAKEEYMLDLYRTPTESRY